MPWPPDAVLVGWDIGGAHVKACRVEAGEVRDIAQWPCPLWQGLHHLDAVLGQARQRWPQAWSREGRHVATMTGEMVDLFPDRAHGVAQLAAHLAERLGPTLRLYAGPGRWVAPHDGAASWQAIASANWRATAQWLAPRVREAVLVDIGSTTTDLIALRDGAIAARGASDAERLASGELVYQGVVRTPLCALAPRVPFGGQVVNVMHEFFATTADVYRLTGELDPAHDQQPTADGQPKDLPATRRRLARMVGRDALDALPAQWLELAQAWRTAQLEDIAGQFARVAEDAGVGADAPVIGAGCGAFLAAALAARAGRRYRRFAQCAPQGPADPFEYWADVCAPAVAVALLAAGGD
ncbi:hydantoinase/oxoprolinase family protein [Piscinibacter sp. XHJ-5]|uniref:hydantoinase/oxoprolinase family protein n=1 Tax=Piscinibacter sp. XHJ-5 TaxID=3037797 RepID=UPI00245363EA|nr:hydantoinase/oxoprolinase family protein [Piscinibacter sp. XHJ-5]